MAQRIVYPAVREMDWQRLPEAPAPNCWSLDHDRKAWGQVPAYTQYKNPRSLIGVLKPASSADFYQTDQGSKMSIKRQVQGSALRYSSMRKEANDRVTGTGSSAGATSPAVGPGSYTQHMRSQQKIVLGTKPFMDRQPRMLEHPYTMQTGEQFFVMSNRTAEPGYASLAADQRDWVIHGNRRVKGAKILDGSRFHRAPGPGSNVPDPQIVPGPGTYTQIHAWPKTGFIGTSNGFNHNR